MIQKLWCRRITKKKKKKMRAFLQSRSFVSPRGALLSQFLFARWARWTVEPRGSSRYFFFRAIDFSSNFFLAITNFLYEQWKFGLWCSLRPEITSKNDAGRVLDFRGADSDNLATNRQFFFSNWISCNAIVKVCVTREMCAPLKVVNAKSNEFQPRDSKAASFVKSFKNTFDITRYYTRGH